MRWLLWFRLRNLWKSTFSVVWMYIAGMMSFLRRRDSYIVERHRGKRDLAGARRVAVFAHYDRRGRVHDYVIHYLNSLRTAGFEVVFVSNAPRLPIEAIAKLKPFCALIMRRRNVGYDFAAYKDGIGVLADVAALEELIVANDSVYGPFADLATVLSPCASEKAAVWGITDSWFRRYHVQSYFILFKHAALANEGFWRFWSNVRYVQSKRWTIEKYEIGLSQAMSRSGLRCAALYPYRRVAAAVSAAVAGMIVVEDEKQRLSTPTRQRRFANDMAEAIERGRPLNSTHHLWDFLISDMACPFFKRELLGRNPMEVPSLQRWEKVISDAFDYDTDLILRHLEEQARNRAV
jgi:lipopolysaccharide biosynthesis protein